MANLGPVPAETAVVKKGSGEEAWAEQSESELDGKPIEEVLLELIV